MRQRRFTSFEVCAGAGGLAVGLEQAGFDPVLLIDNRKVACDTLWLNRPQWDVQQADLHEFDVSTHPQVRGVDLLVAGLPRVQASATVNRTRGSDRELSLLRALMLLFRRVEPRALLIENVPDLVTKPSYQAIRDEVSRTLDALGYRSCWSVISAEDFRVPQFRQHGILVATADGATGPFAVPPPCLDPPVTVGAALRESMGSQGWPQADEWAEQADHAAPTLVGGSWERGGADLGPRGSKRAWERMGVNGASLADALPAPDFHWDPTVGRDGMVRLTVEQAARLQCLPIDWQIAGRKTARYRQIAEACPPPVARAVGTAIAEAFGVS